jgi:hypothetical protein
MDGFEHQMDFPRANARATTSPSVTGTDCRSGISDIMLDGAINMMQPSASIGQQSTMAPRVPNDPYWDMRCPLKLKSSTV